MKLLFIMWKAENALPAKSGATPLQAALWSKLKAYCSFLALK